MNLAYQSNLTPFDKSIWVDGSGTGSTWIIFSYKVRLGWNSSGLITTSNDLF